MDDRFIKLALDAGLLNYVDHETPRHYFINGHANLKDVAKFAELVVLETRQEAADEIERLREKYEEAIDDIEEWGAYASEYFQEKWKLKECIEQHRAALKEAE